MQGRDFLVEIKVLYCDFKAAEESKQGPIFLLPSLKYSKIPQTSKHFTSFCCQKDTTIGNTKQLGSKVAAQCAALEHFVAVMRLLQPYYPISPYSGNTLEYFCKPEQLTQLPLRLTERFSLVSVTAGPSCSVEAIYMVRSLDKSTKAVF